jgi:cell division protein FtsQ
LDGGGRFVFALKSGQGKKDGAAKSAPCGLPFSVGGFVLPRLLRRPARLLARANDGELTVPPFAATIATAAFLSASGLYGAYVGGHFPALVQSITARTGFAVDQVRVSGHHETSEIDILGQLELDGWTSLIGFDAEKARQRIAELPWVQSAAVRKVYPDEIEVRVEERKPFAIWQHGRELAIVEESGNVIAPFSSERHAILPLVIGLGAPEKAAQFIKKVKSYPELASRIKGYIRVGERRWDLRLENGVTVKLPENGEVEAIEDILAMDKESGVLSRDIAAVDMRLNDRLVIQLTPEAALRRNAALNEKTKPGKKPERRI